MRNVFLYPVFEDKTSFDDVMSRAAWYFEPWLANIKNFHVGASADFSKSIQADQRLDPAVAAKIPSLLKRTVVHNTAATTNASLADAAKADAELLLIWKMPEQGPEREKAQNLYDAVRARGWLSYVIDKDSEMSHGCNWLWGSITLASRSERESLHAQSYDALLHWAGSLRSPRAYVLGTGPNLEQALNRDFSDGDAIIANSVIKNRSLMERLKPVAVCACDPIFHAGVSLYAAEFRQTLIQAMDDFPRMFFFAPHRDQKIYLANLPARLHNRCVFVPIDTNPGVAWNFDLQKNFYLVPEGNVLTQMMLPIAAAFHEKISVIGCDGRPLSQNTYFWSHHKSSQFNDQMQNIQEVHPAFFSLRDYDDHYSEHCADTARIIANLEGAGKRVECLTDSYIPALQSRYTLEQRPLGDGVVFVSLNPNLRGRYGHLLGYDEGLREAVESAGARFLTLGSKTYADGDGVLLGAGIQIEPCFSDNVYAALTRKLPDVDQDAVLNFEREFEAAVVRHKREHAGKRLAYYLYMGSLPHAVAMANVCARHPDISATVNTFGECIMDCMRDGHIDEWKAFLRSAAQQGNFAVLAITPQLKREVGKRCGVDLPLCPHPTGAFEDSRFAAWIKELERAPLPGAARRLVFPGGFWGEKNFDLTCEIARLAAAKDYVCTVRTGPLESANRQQLDARAAILPYARTADGTLSGDEYRALFVQADIAVLTYRRSDWRIRNSSVVIDCLYAGLPMVVVNGTWLADLVEQFGCGEVVADETPEAFMSAIQRIGATYPTYRHRTIEAARAYQGANSFADVVSAAIAPLWREPDANANAYDPQTIPAALQKMRAAAQRQGTPSSKVMPVDSKLRAEGFELTRDADCMFEELSVVRTLLRDRDPSSCVMIDVGAHSGGSFPPFLDLGWTVYAFEPDPSNRAGISERYLDNPRFILDPRALSDKIQEGVPFYTSSESTGISGLSAFHNTHVETTRVSTTTLAEVVRQHSIRDITLLKVDTEGFDLFVLKGMPWDKLKPDVVITEYENNKTEKLGYTFEDQIRMLESHGYTVFVSEWWPIVRYGIRHHWRSLYPASAKRPPAASWGNLIAFRKPPPLGDLYAAMFEAIDLPRDGAKLSQAQQEIAAIHARQARGRAEPATAFAARAPSPAQWLRARLTPARKQFAVAGGLWGSLSIALTALVMLAPSPNAAPLLSGTLTGAAIAAWLGVFACAMAALVFMRRQGIVRLLEREPAIVALLRTLNSLQRHRRRELIVSARAVGALGLGLGATIGAAASGALSPWIWAPPLVVLVGAIFGITAAWALAALFAIARNEADAVTVRKYDRVVAVMQADIAAQARLGSQHTREINETRKSAEQSLQAFRANMAALDDALRKDVNERLSAQDGALKAYSQRTEALGALLPVQLDRLERLRANFAALDDEFRSDILGRIATMRDDFDYALRRRSAEATAAAVAETASALAQLEEQVVDALVAMAKSSERHDAALAEARNVADKARDRADQIAAETERNLAVRLAEVAAAADAAAQTLALDAHAQLAAAEQRLGLAQQQLMAAFDARLNELQADVDNAAQATTALVAAGERRGSQSIAALAERLQELQTNAAEAQQAMIALLSEAERRGSIRAAELADSLQELQAGGAKAQQAMAEVAAEAERRWSEAVSEDQHLAMRAEQAALAAKTDAIARTSELLAASEAKVIAQARRIAEGNEGRYLNFNRKLTDASAEKLLNWGGMLGVKIDAAALAFMAHRIEAMETVALGRLAASVETQILRNLVALSIRAECFEAAEIGTLYGLGAAALLEAADAKFPAARVTVIDPFSGYYEDGRDPLLGLPVNRRGFEQNMARLGIPSDRYRVVQGFSEDEASIAAAGDTLYNLLLIDGDHSYQGVRRDFENYASMVDRYGCVLIDDYDEPEYPGVQRFVDETLKADSDLQFVGAAFSTAVFRVWRKKS